MSEGSRHREKATLRKQRFRERNHTYTLSLPKPKAQELEHHAKKKGLKVSEYLKALTCADIHGTGYVLPRDNRLQELTLALRRVGNNANQLTRYAHYEKGITKEEIQQFQVFLRQIESEVQKALTRPPNILDLLCEHIEQSPKDRELIIQWLHDNKGTGDKEP